MSTINLRGDLAKLSDAELSERLEAAWHAYAAAEQRPFFWRSRAWLSPGFAIRGPIRHPRFYRFFSALGTGSGAWCDFLFAAILTGKDGERLLRNSDPLVDGHICLCEIRDLNDEIKRRLAKPKQVKA